MPNNNDSKSAFYFVTEQACCLAQASGRDTDDFRACHDAAEYLSDGNEEMLAAFTERTSAVKRDLTGLEDYDTEQYDGKEQDINEAVSALSFFGTAEDTPEQIRGSLLTAADLIACFYDVDNAISAVTA